MSIQNHNKYQRKSNIPWQSLGEETLVLHAESMMSFEMAATGTFIWEKLDGTFSVDEIAEGLHNEFDVDLATAKQDTIHFMTELLNEGLICH